ncbi:MAG: hypothetical protein LBJ25_03360 [Candidatus Margulisbacteria bacterium]|jgi:microcystin-dependent protein|nr:hypothetical protein [Candidatus Margulisiibacteriota bacterium]
MTIATGQPMLASDINNLTFFPIGTILMYDGAGWQDNVTLSGWYKCDAANAEAGRAPNLENRFIRGGTIAGNGRGNTGGSDSVTLMTSNLPSHDHSLTGLTIGGGNHSHSAGTLKADSGSAEHSHGAGTLKTATGGSHEHTFSNGATNETGAHQHILRNYGSGSGAADGDGGWTDIGERNMSSSAGNHSHTVTGSISSHLGHTHDMTGSTEQASASHTHNISGNTAASTEHTHTVSGGTISSTGSGSSFNVTPPYYSVIYIRKCA